MLRVRDTGIGIPSDILPQIFDPFVQETDGAQGGLGIGLHIVSGLVRLHGGTVTAASTARGKAANSVVRLPLAAEPSEEACQGRVLEIKIVAGITATNWRTSIVHSTVQRCGSVSDGNGKESPPSLTSGSDAADFDTVL